MSTSTTPTSAPPTTLTAALGLTLLGGVVNTARGVAGAVDDGLTGGRVLGLVLLLVVSMLPAMLAWFARRGYFLAWAVLIISSGLTLLTESPRAPQVPAVALVVLAFLTLGCLLVPVTRHWIQDQRPTR